MNPRIDGPRVVVALDYPDDKGALALADRLDPGACRVKVGKELFTAAGPAFVEALARRGFDVFLDLKFHDIPNTVAQACKSAARLGVWMMNVHALGGRAMLEAARGAIDPASGPRLIAVTVLTSMSEPDLREVGIDASPLEEAMRLARLAAGCGLDGVVCSAHEAGAIAQAVGPHFLRVTPGIRLAEDAAGDQKRVMTPALALQAGATHLVIGRSVTRAEQPLQVLQRINTELGKLESHA
ncbi:MAG TPA: orotidine-5'-phosphate decarboxylase [Burkholderiales bacterium]|jgi:orotidine-5'-phosphate decarboxylase|nr:orotidine-5'-phosphate decarboxylase [Burkholderiales bacterium]